MPSSKALAPQKLQALLDVVETVHRLRAPGGCPAQAWSVSEALRVLSMVTRAEAGLEPEGR